MLPGLAPPTVTRVTVVDIARAFAPALRGRNVTAEQALRLNRLITEGVQLPGQ
jgi:hypothetical protein